MWYHPVSTPMGGMPGLYFCRAPTETKQAGQVPAGRAVTEEEWQGEWTTPAPHLAATRSEVTDGSEGEVPSVPAQWFPSEAWIAQPATEDGSAAPAAQATGWGGTTMVPLFFPRLLNKKWK